MRADWTNAPRISTWIVAVPASTAAVYGLYHWSAVACDLEALRVDNDSIVLIRPPSCHWQGCCYKTPSDMGRNRYPISGTKQGPPRSMSVDISLDLLGETWGPTPSVLR
ncbi:hypothetical protein PG997_008323 [Apiospora hydei]|uniref:Secreted protein n=1 Tax=Apiospora hydei TaxID=1337664 RepID=A0ABR1WAG0_9PEZI